MAARISQRQSFWRFSSSALYICRSCSRSTFFREWFASRQPNCSSVSTCKRRGLALQRIEVDGERPRAVRRVDRVDAGLVVSSKNALAGGDRHDRPVRLVDDQCLGGVRRRPAAARDRRPRDSPPPHGRGSRASSKAVIKRHELRRPRELAVGRLPAARQDDQPSLADRFSR